MTNARDFNLDAELDATRDWDRLDEAPDGGELGTVELEETDDWVSGYADDDTDDTDELTTLTRRPTTGGPTSPTRS